jgi:hypothetical protein
MAVLSRFLLLTLVVSFVHLFNQTIQACSCPPVVNTPASEYASSAIVFVGTVTEISGPGSQPFFESIVKFSVQESFKGVNGSEITLKTYSSNFCGYNFQTGKTYLVYTNGNVSYCSRTRPIESAGEDLRYLRNITLNRIIYEDFNNPTNNFTVVRGGRWSVTQSRYELVNPANINRGNGNISVHKTSITGDFTLMADALVKPTTGRWDDFSIIFNYQDRNNYYYASFSESNDDGVHGIFRVLNGRVSQLVDFSGKINADQWYKITVRRLGDKISVQLVEPDPVVPSPIPGLKIEAEVTDSSFKNGRVGFGSKNNAASFDNLIVLKPRTGPTPPAPTNLKAQHGIQGNCGNNRPIRLTWDASAGATSYNIKKSNTCNGTYQTIATGVSATYYDDTSVWGGCYVVTAVNEAGESQPSNSAQGYMAVADCFPPQLRSLNPTSGPIGTKVTLDANMIMPGIPHRIRFGFGIVKEFTPTNVPDPNLLTFEVPASIDPACRLETPPCGVPSISVQPGIYGVSISNKYGTSNPIPFEVTQ